MANERNNVEQTAEDLLGLKPTTQLTRVTVQLALARAQAAIEKMPINEYEKTEMKKQVYTALMRLLFKAKLKKSREQWDELREFYDEILKNPLYKSPEPKKKPTEVPIAKIYESPTFVLLNGTTLNDIQALFRQWVVDNRLVDRGFSLVIQASASAANMFALAIRGPAEDQNAGRLGAFFQQLVTGGYIKPNAQVIAAAPIHTPTSLPTLIPTPKPGKKVEEEEEKQSASLGTSKSFGTPTPTPHKK